MTEDDILGRRYGECVFIGVETCDGAGDGDERIGFHFNDAFEGNELDE